MTDLKIGLTGAPYARGADYLARADVDPDAALDALAHEWAHWSAVNPNYYASDPNDAARVATMARDMHLPETTIAAARTAWDNGAGRAPRWPCCGNHATPPGSG